jgi:hypothetical protein
MIGVRPFASYSQGLGITSVVLGIISLLLFFFPPLALPIGGIGALLGLIGLFLAWGKLGPSLRLCAGGLVVSLAGVIINLLLWNSPRGFFTITRGYSWPAKQEAPELPYTPRGNP